MSFEVTVNIKGLEGLSQAITALAGAVTSKSISAEAVAAKTAQVFQTAVLGQGGTVALDQPVPQPQPVPVPQPQPQPVPVPQPQPLVPTTTVQYTIEDLSNAARPLMDAGRTDEVRNLLAQFGVQALTVLPKEQYGAFATGLRALGAQI